MVIHIRNYALPYKQPRTVKPEINALLEAADGYLFLNLPAEALDELNGIPEEESHEPPIILATCRVLIYLKRWHDAEETAKIGCSKFPEEDELIVQRAFVLNQLDRVNEASRVILSAPTWLQKTGIIHYNLACYEARFGNLEIAKRCLDVACQLNEAMKKKAHADPDLRRIWN